MQMYVVCKKDRSKFVCFNDVVGYHLSNLPELMMKEESIGCLEHCDPRYSNFCEDENVEFSDLEIIEVELNFKN